MPSSVMIVDDSQIVRKVMHDFFNSRTDWKIVGEAGDGAEAIQKARELRPDLIFMDFSMPQMNGIESAPVLKKLLPGVRIIVFTMFDDALGSTLRSAAGVDLVVSKAGGLTDLVKAAKHLIGAAALTNSEAKANQEEPSTAEQP